MKSVTLYHRSIIMLVFIICIFFTAQTTQAQYTGIISTAWSPDGSMIAVGGANGLLQIRDTANQVVRTFTGLTTNITTTDWSPDGSKIVSGGNDGLVLVWNVNNGQQLANLTGLEAYIFQVDWSADGSKILATGRGNSKSLITWNASNYQQIASVDAGQSLGANWSPDSTKLAVGQGDGSVFIYTSTLGTPIASFAVDSGVITANWSPDGSKIVAGTSIAGSDENKIKVWDVNTTNLIATYSGHTNMVGAVSFSPNGQKIASGSNDGTVKIWDVATGQQIVSYVKPQSLTTSIAWSPDSSQIAFGGTNGELQIVSASAAPTPTNPPPPAPTTPRSVAWNPDGIWIARAFQNGTIDVVNANTGATVFTFSNGQSPATALAWRPGSGSTKLVGAIAGSVYVWDVPTANMLFALPSSGAAINSLDWTTQNGDKIVGSSYEGPAPNLRVWDASTGQLTFSKNISQLAAASWSPNGTKVVIGSSLQIEIVDLGTSQNQLLSANSYELSPVSSVAWSPDGTKIANSGVLGQVTFYTASTGQFIAYSNPSRLLVRWLVWSNDSTRLASASWDGTVRVWNAANGALIDTIQPNNGRVFSVDWSPDDRQLVVGSENGAVQIFPAMNICPATLFGTLATSPTFTPPPTCTPTPTATPSPVPYTPG